MTARYRSSFKRRARTSIVGIAVLGILCAGVAGAFATPSNVHVRVEGAARTVFSADVTPQSVVMTDSDGGMHPMDGNALWALGSAARQGGFPYVLKDSSYGLYIDSVAGELPVPLPPYPGWLYRVNGVSAMVGADQYALSAGDDVLWYYGAYDASPAVVAVPSEPVVTGSVVTITARQLDPTGVASPLPGATVHVGSSALTADALGQVSYTPSVAGDVPVRAESPGCIRSATSTLRVREVSRLAGASAKTRRIRVGSTYVFRSTLRSQGSALSKRSVKVYARKPGSSKWKLVARKTTDARGRISARLRPRSTTYYRAVWDGDATRLGSIGATYKITVKR